MIIGVAIKTPDDTILIRMPSPNRHHNCFEYAKKLGIKTKEIKLGMRGVDQGFYTHTGKYLNREQAYSYAKRIKQKMADDACRYLFSEDLW